MDSVQRNGKHEANDYPDTYSPKSNNIHKHYPQQNWFMIHVIIRQHNNTNHIEIYWQIQKGE